jgi:putative oxidoreductase
MITANCQTKLVRPNWRGLSLPITTGTKTMHNKLAGVALLLLRVALAAGFLSAVADRLGLWGPAGSGGVEWGDLAHFNAYVAKLNWFLPASIIPWVGWAATLAESLLAVGLLVGWQLRWIALGSATLLLSFAITMIIALGPKAPLDYSVFTSATAAFLLFVMHSNQ